jgi:hypothetical protein
MKLQKLVAENQQEVDFSAERPDGAFCASDKLLQQIVANQGENHQQSDYSVFPKFFAAKPTNQTSMKKAGWGKLFKFSHSPLCISMCAICF